MKKIDVSKMLLNLSDKLALIHSRKVNSRVNKVNAAEKYLKIPLIGGFIYILASFFMAIALVEQNKKEVANKSKIRNVIHDRNIIRRSIQKQLDDVLSTGDAVKINVPRDYLFDFLEVVKYYPITYNQLSETEFLLIVKEVSF